TGVMVFVFYQFNATPLNFNPLVEEAGVQQEQYQDLQRDLETNQKKKAEVSLAFATTDNPAEKAAYKEEIKFYTQKDREIRTAGTDLVSAMDENLETNDKDYVFIHFILNNLPRGLIGLLLAVI